MTIVDAIDSAPTEHAIFFLVTAYIESLKHFERGSGVPATAIELPVTGASDLETRLAMLQGNAGRMPEPTVAQMEVAAVIRAALTRLSVLGKSSDNALSAGAMRPARSDSLHSSLSV